VVDGSIGWTGGFGLDDKWLGGGAGRRVAETNARFEGPAVASWKPLSWQAGGRGERGVAHRPVDVPEDAGGGAMAGLLFTHRPLAARRRSATSRSDRRRASSYIANSYFAPDTNFAALLARAATPGVDVRLLVVAPDRHPRRAAGGARTIRALLRRGADLRIPADHAACQDVRSGRPVVSIEGMNFDNRSLALNDEASLMVLDSAVGQRMERCSSRTCGMPGPSISVLPPPSWSIGWPSGRRCG
jgi:cardiolipin synthase